MGVSLDNSLMRDGQTSNSCCRTPGAVYTTTVRPWVIAAFVRVPAGTALFGRLTKDQERTLIADLHHAILPVIEGVYRDTWSHLAGKLLPDCGDEPMPDRWSDLKAPEVGAVPPASPEAGAAGPALTLEVARLLALHGLGTVSGADMRAPPNESWKQEEWERRILECLPTKVERKCLETATTILAYLAPAKVRREGAPAFIAELGWSEVDGQKAFRATVVFPDGPPDFPPSIVWNRTPVAIRTLSTEPSDAER